MIKEFEICGCIQVQPEITEEEFWNAFIEFVESKGWYFGGITREIQDGFYINPDSTIGSCVSEDDNGRHPK